MTLRLFLFRLKRKLSTMLMSDRITLNGKTVKVPIIDGCSCDQSEPWMLDLLNILLANSEEGIFLDIGVNLGQTLTKVKSICPGMRYLGMEPNSFCVYYTRRLVEMNHYLSATIIPSALFDIPGIIDLFSYAESPSDSSASIVKDFRGEDSLRVSSCIVAIDASQLTAYLDDALISIVKIDVEGAELECLCSLEGFIGAHRPLILVEILPIYSKKNTYRLKRQQKIEDFCVRIGYIIYRIDKDPLDRFAGLQGLDEFGIHADLTKCDYILVSRDLASLQLKGLLD